MQAKRVGKRRNWRRVIAPTIALSTMVGLAFVGATPAAYAQNCPDILDGPVCGGGGGTTTLPPVVDPPTSSPTASPSPATTPTDIGVQIADDGWITYTHLRASSLDLISATTQTITGTFNADGDCEISASGSDVDGATAMYQEDFAYNPVTCQQKIIVGGLSSESVSKITDPEDVALESTATDTAVADIAAAADAADASAQSTATTKASTTRYMSAYEKTAWIDPVFITITSMTTNLRWPLNGAGGTLTGRNNPCMFPYDGWSSSGTPPVRFTTLSNSAGWSVNAKETFVNRDFASIVYLLLGTAGWLACGAHLTNKATFKHNVTVTGYRNGKRGWAWSDTKSGACSNLVHHGQWNGTGWSS